MMAFVTDAPALPDPVWMRIGMSFGWAVVMGFWGGVLTTRCRPGWQRTGVALMALWALVPGTLSVTYWLGLAFHAPSMTTVLVCGLYLKRQLFLVSGALPQPLLGARSVHWWWAAAGVLLGYLLLGDTFAMLPVQLYAWGFSTQAVVVVAVLVLLPWVLCAKTLCRSDWAVWLLPVALLVYVLSRLPTGNLWDALLDPWLWGGLQWLLLHAVWRRIRVSRSAIRD